MVWIHGGTFLIRLGIWYDGHELAEKGHVIVVTINYQLGPFGFLANRALDGADPDHPSGKRGLAQSLGGFELALRQAALDLKFHCRSR